MRHQDMPPQEFRQYGRRLVDWIAGYLSDPRQYPVVPDCLPGALRAQLPAKGPDHGESLDAILHDFERLILPAVTHWNHPRFHAYFSNSSTAPGILGELLTAALDVNAMLWKSCPAATELEQTTAAWVLDWLGLPGSWFGMIVDSASNAVLQAIVAARERTEPESRGKGSSGRIVAYVSEHTHSSVEKAAIAAGIGQTNVRVIPTGRGFRMKPGALARAIAADQKSGLIPFFVAATVGTTSSAAADPVAEIAEVARDRSLWLHVDGAYGGTYAVLPECRNLLRGVELADSFVVNAHKLMLVPLDCTLFYTAHPAALRRAFALEAEYLKTGTQGLDYMDYGLALGRRFRALKLWFVLRYFGREGLAANLRENLAMTAWLGRRIRAHPRLELAAPATLGLVCFRSRRGDSATRDLLERINASRRFFLSHTVLRGRLTIRAAIGNIRTTRRDVADLWHEIAASEAASAAVSIADANIRNMASY